MILDTSQLPHLMKLIDDEDPAVRASILDALAAFGPDLDDELARLPEPPDPDTVAEVKRMLADHVGQAEADPGPGEVTRRMGFRPGQLVRHRRYGYRGVVVDGDRSCQADEDWYQSNQSRPERGQPWYHVLVHNSMQVTYAAQSNLEADDTGDEVIHPYVPYFFSEFRDGEYVRNDQPWPS